MSTFLRTLTLACFLFALPLSAQANKLLMPGDVIEGHAKEEEKCEVCHKKFDKKAQSQLCMDCHKEVGKDVTEKKGHHGRIDTTKECKECHDEHKGRDFKAATFDQKLFDHKLTDFVLKGGHLGEKVKCESCHKAGKKFREAPSLCHTCHEKDDEKAHKGKLGKDCAKCHTDKDWKSTSFEHDKTEFKLVGKHIEVKCLKCHIDHKYKDIPKTCVGCHKKDDDKAHKGKLGPKCETCHTAKDWKVSNFDHDKTEFKLLGKHVDVKCVKCHIDNKFKETPKTCVGCHKKDDDKAHKGNFGTKCETCHTAKEWKDITFDHGKTKFALLGKHKSPPLKCTACHKGDLYKDKLELPCFSCHKKEDDKAHKGKFGPKCEVCHDENDWKKPVFDHDKKTKFPLLGKHRAPLKCNACHKGDLYKDKLAMECFSCHEKDDKHKTQEGKKCETCHGAEDWHKTTFDHQRMSTYPLLGRHILVACKKCHDAPTFKDAHKECVECHDKDDVHKRRLGTECKACHSTRAWQSWDFDHNKTKFKLEGPHKKTANKCYSCHSKPMGKVVTAPTACGACHERDDVHNGNFGDRCDRCHDGNDWKQIKMGMETPPAKGSKAGASKK
jgi:hypothetical protein